MGETDISVCRSSYENYAYDFVFVSPAVSRMSCSLYLDGLGVRKTAVLLGGTSRICSRQHTAFLLFSSSFFSLYFVSVHCLHTSDYADSGCSLEDLQGAMNNRDGQIDK